jgi:MFS family permease
VSVPTSRSLVRAAIGPAGVGFRRFWLATSVSVLGTWMAAVALSIRMFDVTGSPGWVSALLVAEFTPTVLIGFAFGHMLDRLPLRRSLMASDLGGAAAFAALALIDTPWMVVLLAGVAGTAAGVFRPLATAAVPLMVSDDDLETATGAIGSADNAMTFLGEVIGGVLVGSIGAELALALNAVSFAGSALLISTCTSLARRGSDAPAERAAIHALATFARIRRSPVLRQIAVGWTIATPLNTPSTVRPKAASTIHREAPAIMIAAPIPARASGYAARPNRRDPAARLPITSPRASRPSSSPTTAG